MDDVFARAIIRVGEDQKRAADLHSVAIGQWPLADLFAVDERAVGAIEIDQGVALALLAHFGVSAGDFVIGKLDAVGGVAAERQRQAAQLVALAFVATLHYEERR